MKVSSIFKYIFIIFAVGIIIYAGYRIYKNNSNENVENYQAEETSEETIIKNIRVALTDYDNINPLITNNKEILNLDTLIFEPLFTLNSEYQLEPCLATECSKTGDNIYVVKIDNTKNWHDGTPLIAKDVAFTIETIKNGNSVYKYNVEHISKVEVIDAGTIKITLDANVPFFEYNLIFPIMSDAYYYGEDFYNSSKVPIGTGKYKISELGSNNIVLVKNEKYKGNEEAKIDTIKINVYSSMGEAFNSFKIGNIDILNTSNANFQEYIGTIGFNKTEYAGREFDFLALNCKDTLLQDATVRKALSYAIDKDNIVTSVFNNQRQTAEYPLDYGNFLYQKQDVSSGYNAEQSKKVLEEGGWTYTNNKWRKKIDGSTQTLKLTISVNQNNEARIKVAEKIKEQLENIGISVTINKISDEKYGEYINNKDYQILLTGVYTAYTPDLTYYFYQGNIFNYESDSMNELITQSLTIKDTTQLKEIYQKIYSKYKEDVPFIGLYRNKNITLTSQSLEAQLTPTNYTTYYNFETWYRK